MASTVPMMEKTIRLVITLITSLSRKDIWIFISLELAKKAREMGKSLPGKTIDVITYPGKK